MRRYILVILFLLGGCVSQPVPDGFEAPDDFDTDAAAKTRISLGLTYLKNGNYTQAKMNLDRALEFAPRMADAHYSIAYYYQLVGEVQRAEESYQDAMRLAPRNADIANSYGAFLCQQGNYPKAKEFFLKAINNQRYANTAESYENMALCSQSQGQIDDAIEYLQNALNHQPTRGKSLYLLAELLTATERYEEARQTLRRFERVSRVSAESLWLAAEIEHGLGNIDAARGYGDMLLQMYPQHPNTQRYLATHRSPDAVAKQRMKKAPTINQPATMPVQKPEPMPEPASQPVSEPAAQESSEPEAEPVADTQQPDEESSVAPVVTKHIVEKQENLYRISLRYNVKMDKLVEWNNLDDPSSIYTGMSLWVVDPSTQQ